MRDALNGTGRPIFYAMCEWGVDAPASWARVVGNSWRTTIGACSRGARRHRARADSTPCTLADIEDTWLSVLLNLELTAPLWRSSGPGGFNDPGSVLLRWHAAPPRLTLRGTRPQTCSRLATAG